MNHSRSYQISPTLFCEFFILLLCSMCGCVSIRSECVLVFCMVCFNFLKLLGIVIKYFLSLLRLHGFLLTRLIFQSLKKQRKKQRTPCTILEIKLLKLSVMVGNSNCHNDYINMLPLITFSLWHQSKHLAYLISNLIQLSVPICAHFQHV